MPAPIRKYDALGFPVPSTFEELSKSAETPTRPAGPSRAKRRIMVVLILIVALLAVVPWAKTAGQAMLASWWTKEAQDRFEARDFLGAVENSTRRSISRARIPSPATMPACSAFAPKRGWS